MAKHGAGLARFSKTRALRPLANAISLLLLLGVLVLIIVLWGLNVFARIDAKALATLVVRVLRPLGGIVALALAAFLGVRGHLEVAIPLGICFCVREFGHLEPIHIWLAILAGHMTRCILSVIRFYQGKWRNIAVDIEQTAG